MKARKFIKRDRHTAGKATGSLVVNLRFPETDDQYDLRPIGDTKGLFEKTRSFLVHHLQERTLQMNNASFTIYAEIRAENGALRRKSLSDWHNGDSFDQAINTARQTWESLEFEQDYESFDTEI